ncbi:MAG: general secretion pathway protein GspB [Deltaproteobacteria bacterium]|nr:general secretion pathway protein GspB [Deltaproteobacteria bacterium]
MSYILEALKKLERKRQQEETSPILNLADSPGPEDRIKPLWLYLVALGLILNAGIFFWWVFHPGSSGTPMPGKLPAPRVASKAALPPPPPVEADRSVFPPKKEPAPEPLRSPAKPRTVAAPPPLAPPREKASLSEQAKTPSPKPTPEKIPTPEPVKKPSPAPPAEKPAVAETAKAPSPSPPKKEPPRSDRVLQMNELPADIRNALPPLKVSTHIYSIDPQSRLVRVNEQILQEGQVSLEGLKVEEIVPKGIIFRYQGYRFRIGIQ